MGNGTAVSASTRAHPRLYPQREQEAAFCGITCLSRTSYFPQGGGFYVYRVYTRTLRFSPPQSTRCGGPVRRRGDHIRRRGASSSRGGATHEDPSPTVVLLH